MPFQYSYLPVEAYRSPYAQAIAGAMGGADRARAVAAEQSGQIAANAVGQLGTTLSQLPQQVQRQHAQQTQQQSAAIDLQAKQRGEAARNALADVMQSTPKLSEDGVSVWDVPAITRTLADKGFGPEAAGAAQHLTGINEAFRQARTAQTALVKAGAASIAAAGNDPVLAGHFLDQLEQNRTYPKETVDQYRAFIAADPSNVAKLTAALMGPQKMENAAPGSSARNPVTGAIVPGSTAPPKPPDKVFEPRNVLLDGEPQEVSFDKSSGKYVFNGEDVTGRVAPAGAPKSLQSRSVLLDGQPAEVSFNPTDGTYQRDGVAIPAGRVQPFTDPLARARFNETLRHNRVTEDPLGLTAGAPPAAGIPSPGAATPAGGGTPAPLVAPAAQSPPAAGQETPTTGRNEAALATLPPPVAAQVKAIVDGKRALDPRTASTPAGRQLLSLAYAYDPSFDQVNYNARAKTRADFTSGASAKNVNALNTVIGHLSELSDAADALHNTWSPMWNNVANAVSTGAGNPAVKKYETVQNAVADEATRVWRQAGGTEADIKSWKHDLDAAGSPEQLHGVIATIGDLLSSKLEALQTQYQQGMGAADLKVITPQAAKTLELLRGRSAKPGADAVTAGARAITVAAPSGDKSYSFKSQAEADAFVAAAKAKGLWK